MKNLRQKISIAICSIMLANPFMLCAAQAAVPQTEQQTMQVMTVSTIPKGYAYIPKDTILTVELENELSSKKAKKDDQVSFKLCDNVVINGTIVIPAGANVIGHVVEVTKSGLFGRAGKLSFSIDSVKTINNITVPLEYNTKKEAGSDDGAVAVAVAVSLIGGLFMKGKNVAFPAKTKFEAIVSADTNLNVTLKDLPEVMNPNVPHGTTIIIQ